MRILISLYDYSIHECNELLGDGREAGNLFEYVESFCENNNRPIPVKFEDIEAVIKEKDFFRYMLSQICSGEWITISSMEIFPELRGDKLPKGKENELFILFCAVLDNYFKGQYDEEWEFVNLDKYDDFPDEIIFVGKSKLHIDGKIELVIYSEPIDMNYDDDSMPIGSVEYIEAIHSFKHVDKETRRKLRKKGITRGYDCYKEMLPDEYSCITAKSHNIFGAEIHDSDLFVFIDKLVGDTMYSDCMLIIEGYRYLPQNQSHDYMEIDSKWQNIENRSLFMSFREFLIDGCKVDGLNYDEKNHAIQILGDGHYETKGSSVFCDIRLGFNKIKLFWNAEYDKCSGEKLAGAERNF